MAFYKMLTVKKQRLPSALALLVLQLTVLLPLSIMFLILSSVLDLPYMPYMGLPLFSTGSTRPMRNWSRLHSNLSASSEASVYNHFLRVSIPVLSECL